MRWDWVPAIGGYLRTQNGRPHNQADGTQVSTNNVVVLVNQYRPTPWNATARRPISVGSGEAYVFTGGNVLAGTWSRADRLSPIILTAPDGTPIELNPGRTFVEMADVDRPRHHLRLTAAGAPQHLPATSGRTSRLRS